MSHEHKKLGCLDHAIIVKPAVSSDSGSHTEQILLHIS